MATTNLDSADLKAALSAPGLIREDVMNKIWDISKIPLPFTDMISTRTHKNEYFEWTEDSLAPPDTTNAKVDGQDLTGNDTKVGTRMGNHSQISTKIVQVSYRAEASDVIGRASELGYQVSRRQQELRRDIEAIMLTNQASVADDGNSTAGKVGSFASFIKTNIKNGTAGGFNTTTKLTVAPTPAAAVVPLTEEDLRDIAQGIYQEGGEVDVMMTIPSVIKQFSYYMLAKTGGGHVASIIADQGKSREAATALGAVNVFVTDFGTMRAVPNRLQPTYTVATKTAASVFFPDPAYLAQSFIKGYQTEPLAKTGLSEKRMITVDWSFAVYCEKANGLILAVDPTAAMIEKPTP